MDLLHRIYLAAKASQDGAINCYCEFDCICAPCLMLSDALDELIAEQDRVEKSYDQ